MILLQKLLEFNRYFAEDDERMSPLDIFVDENGRLGRKASELYLWMKENATPEYRTLMGTSAPLDDKVTIPLQCADLYVGQLREFYIFGTCTDAMGVLMEQQFEQ